MILKTFELEKIHPKKNFFLFYGDNQGYKNEIIEKKFKKNYSENIYNYDENEILNNTENFYIHCFKAFLEKSLVTGI